MDADPTDADATDPEPTDAAHRHQRLVVGVDGSAASGEALQWAADVADACGADLVALSALIGLHPGMDPEQRRELLDWRRTQLAEVWVPAALGARRVDVRVDIQIEDGDPRDVLERCARPTDLLVLGRGGGTHGPGMLHIGSVVEHAAHHIGVPLAVIPSSRHRTIEQIAIGLDGSPTSRYALEWITPIAVAFNAHVIAIYVQRSKRRSAQVAAESSRQAHDDVAEWTAPLANLGVHVTPIAQQHVQPADGVLGIASAQDADLVVAGMRGLGGFTGLRIGGTAMQILHRAARPLVLIPPPPSS